MLLKVNKLLNKKPPLWWFNLFKIYLVYLKTDLVYPGY